MKASIDIKITYDDLSEKCKEKIKRLEKELDCIVNLVYPDITSVSNIDFGKTQTYPYTPPYVGGGSSGNGFSRTTPHDWRDDVVLCNIDRHA